MRGPAAREMKTCSAGCERPAVARGLCRRCYNEHWERDQLGNAPRVEKVAAEQLSNYFGFRLKELEGAHVLKLCRVSGRSGSALLREAVLEYLAKFPIS